MRLLMFQAKRFWWKSLSKTLEDVEESQVEDVVEAAVVVFMQVEVGRGVQTLCAFAAAPVVWVAAALVCLVWFFMLLLAASTNTLLQLGAPDALRGRVMSLFSMLFLGMAPFGALVSGLLAERAGAPLTVGLSGGLCLIAAFFFGRRPKRDAGPE
jgi:hypothetical protein